MIWPKRTLTGNFGSPLVPIEINKYMIRSLRPWIIAYGHRPQYCSNWDQVRLCGWCREEKGSTHQRNEKNRSAPMGIRLNWSLRNYFIAMGLTWSSRRTCIPMNACGLHTMGEWPLSITTTPRAQYTSLPEQLGVTSNLGGALIPSWALMVLISISSLYFR